MTFHLSALTPVVRKRHHQLEICNGIVRHILTAGSSPPLILLSVPVARSTCYAVVTMRRAISR
jgi:hypothetical protein